MVDSDSVTISDLRQTLLEANLRYTIDETSFASWQVTIEAKGLTITSDNRFVDREEAHFARPDVAGLLLELDIRPSADFEAKYRGAVPSDADYMREYGRVPDRVVPDGGGRPHLDGPGDGDGGNGRPHLDGPGDGGGGGEDGPPELGGPGEGGGPPDLGGPGEGGPGDGGPA